MACSAACATSASRGGTAGPSDHVAAREVSWRQVAFGPQLGQLALKLDDAGQQLGVQGFRRVGCHLLVDGHLHGVCLLA